MFLYKFQDTFPAETFRDLGASEEYLGVLVQKQRQEISKFRFFSIRERALMGSLGSVGRDSG